MTQNVHQNRGARKSSKWKVGGVGKAIFQPREVTPCWRTVRLLTQITERRPWLVPIMSSNLGRDPLIPLVSQKQLISGGQIRLIRLLLFIIQLPQSAQSKNCRESVGHATRAL